MTEDEMIQQGMIFPRGPENVNFAKFFTGTSYLQNLVSDPEVNVGVGVVTFEPETRNSWHIHHDGYQILLVTAGKGWYQEEGQAARLLKAGDIVVTHDGVKHWHGATKDSWFAHIAITAGTPEWLEPVSDADYNVLKEEA